MALASVAHARPVHDRVWLAPTAELPEEGGMIGSIALDRHGGFDLGAGYGFGGIAELEFALASSDARLCEPCSPLERSTATFRLGAREDDLFEGAPALVLGVEAGLDAHVSGLHATDAYVVATRHVAFVTLHAGVGASATGHDNGAATTLVRPLGGIEMIPPAFPKTTLLADVSWQPKFATAAGAMTTTTSELAFAWGVRYQTFPWLAVELAVRHDASAFGDPDVLVRVTGQWGTGTLR
ncbi:MAG TPA: hypothetical protein VFQ65_31400, partial [Kofleriaceae bacterium]|nr:hypothetical protein [Kofleriaceae bacterium]